MHFAYSGLMKNDKNQYLILRDGNVQCHQRSYNHLYPLLRLYMCLFAYQFAALILCISYFIAFHVFFSAFTCVYLRCTASNIIVFNWTHMHFAINPDSSFYLIEFFSMSFLYPSGFRELQWITVSNMMRAEHIWVIWMSLKMFGLDWCDRRIRIALCGRKLSRA